MKKLKQSYYDIAIVICLCLISGGIPFSLLIENSIIVNYLNYFVRIAFIVFYFIYINKHNLPLPKTKKINSKALLFIPFILMACSNFLYCFIFNQESINDFSFYNLFDAIVTCLLTATCEELTFRSLLVGEIAKNNSKFKTIFISSILFGLVHLFNIGSIGSILPSLVQVVYSFALGLLLSLMYVYQENIILPIALHFLFNFINSYLVLFFYNYNWDYIYILFNVGVGIVVLLYAYFVYNYLRKKEETYAS